MKLKLTSKGVFITEKHSICVAYTGESVNSGSMDVCKLAPALLSFGELVSECNKVINGDNAIVNVYVKSDFQKGSFEISFETVQNIASHVKSLLLTEPIYPLKDILGILGFLGNVSGISGINVLEMIRWVKNRKIDSVTQADENCVKFNIANESKEISILGKKLFESNIVREKCEGILSPLKNDGIDAFEIRDKSVKEVVQRIVKDEIPYFEIHGENTEEQVFESDRRCVLKVVGVSFENNYKWRFNGGTTDFSASIEDKEFLKKVNAGEVSFANGVALEVTLKEIQKVSFDGNIKMKNSIRRVHRVIAQPEQLSFPFNGIDQE